jgi:hypothetical protein
MEPISCLLILIVLVLLSFLEGWILMLLWNWLAPIFWTSAPELSYWQAMGIMLLLSIIGSFFRSSSNSK